MMKRMFLFVSLMGLVGSAHGSSDTGTGILPKLCRGIALLVAGAVACERVKNSWDDFIHDNPQPATRKEDLKNVVASILCAAAAAYAGDCSGKQIASVVGSGVVLGTVFMGLKQCRGAKELRLREFVPAVALCAAGREGMIAAGLPVLSFAKTN